ncbi:MAG: palmitoyltransferase pfa5 [Pycnora praestabilis]|nr:MAG: palmitoyltransferase pfa5 [Pycnora praestabilis]
MALSYFRILQTIITNPGYVPRGPQLYQQQCDQGKNGRQSDRVKRSFTVASATSQEKFTSGTGLQQDLESGRAAGQYKADSNKPSDQQSSDSQSQGLEYFYTKDVFGEQPSVHWILTLAFASLFALMALGMAGSSIQLAAINSTTVENLSRKVKVWQLAVFIPQPHQGQLGENPATSNGSATTPTTITYPLTTPNPNHDRTLPSITLSGQSSLSTITQKPQPPRTFAILSTPPGANPWDLGTLENLKSVLGNHWYDWLLPLRHSPCCYHDGGESAFQLGGIVNRLRKETGISSTDQISRPSSRRRQRRSTTAMADGSERSQRHGHRSSIRKEEVRRKRKRKRRVRLEAEEPGGAVIR